MEQLLPYLSTLDGRGEEMLQLVVRLAEQNSGTHHAEGVRRVAEIAASELAPLGGECRLVECPPPESTSPDAPVAPRALGPGVEAIKWPQVRPRVLLGIHLDTVYPPEDPFQHCRTLDPQRLNGPGVADAKGGLVVLLHALRVLEGSPWAGRLGWHVVLNPDEEIGSPGSDRWLRAAAAQADLGLLFEPSLPDGALVSWRKGSGNFQFEVHGRAAHSGRDFQAGRNAVVAAARLAHGIDALNTDPEVTFNVARLAGGGAANVVPDHASLLVNVRIVAREQERSVRDALGKLVADVNARDGFSGRMSGGFQSPPKPLDPPTQALQRYLERCGRALGIPVQWRGSGGASDGNRLAAAGLPTIDSLGVCGGEIHSPHEFLLVESLVSRARFAALALLGLASGIDWKSGEPGPR